MPAVLDRLTHRHHNPSFGFVLSFLFMCSGRLPVVACLYVCFLTPSNCTTQRHKYLGSAGCNQVFCSALPFVFLNPISSSLFPPCWTSLPYYYSPQERISRDNCLQLANNRTTIWRVTVKAHHPLPHHRDTLGALLRVMTVPFLVLMVVKQVEGFWR